MNEIEKLKECIVEQLLTIQIYLFGSYANNTFTNESDLDFYIVVKDEAADIPAETARAYNAIRRVKPHPVDIVLGTRSRVYELAEKPRKYVYIIGTDMETLWIITAYYLNLDKWKQDLRTRRED